MSDLDFIKESGVWKEIGNPGCISRLIDMVRKDERENAAKEVEQWIQVHGFEDIAAAIRGMK